MKIHKFDLLFDKIPKDPEVWSQEDVLLWLKLIGMEQYAENFGEMKIDGLIILELNEDELLEELKITMKLHRKKILKAIEVLKEYHEYFRDSTAGGNRNLKSGLLAEEKEFAITNRGVSADQLTKAQDANLSKRGQRIAEELHPAHQRFKNASQNGSQAEFEGEGGLESNVFPRGQHENHSSFEMANYDQELEMFGMRGQPQPPRHQQPQLNVTSSPFNLNNAQPKHNYNARVEEAIDPSKVPRQQNFSMPRQDHGSSGHQGNTNKSADDRFGMPPVARQQSHQSAHQPPSQLQEKPYIVINSIEGPSDLNHSIGELGARIGRHSSNQIVIYDESVSRHHAEIFFRPTSAQFFLKDIGSTTGTFLKIVDPLELKLDMIIEIGSYQLMVSNIFVHNSTSAEESANNSFVELTIYESPEETQERVFTLASGCSIGRKANNALCFSDDLHMSNLHCKINLVGQKFIFEDMASTNGSWQRLSKEGIESSPVPLTHETVFKIGNSAMYEVSVPKPVKHTNDSNTISHNAEKNPGNQSTVCTICWDAERDCLIMPCKHNISCTRCIKSVKNCPICRAVITDIIKIYKS